MRSVILEAAFCALVALTGMYVAFPEVVLDVARDFQEAVAQIGLP